MLTNQEMVPWVEAAQSGQHYLLLTSAVLSVSLLLLQFSHGQCVLLVSVAQCDLSLNIVLKNYCKVLLKYKIIYLYLRDFRQIFGLRRIFFLNKKSNRFET